ncbi:hypothetical protein A2U01_0068624, partial [Trifolium medium]|nr:hypothetical protein [Trifolium medium]
MAGKNGSPGDRRRQVATCIAWRHLARGSDSWQSSGTRVSKPIGGGGIMSPGDELCRPARPVYSDL